MDRIPAATARSRRAFAIGMATALSLAPIGDRGVGGRADDADANPFANLELPEIAVRITNDAIEGAPGSLPAGRYVLAVTNAYADSAEETAGAAFVRLPDSVGADEFITVANDEESDWPPIWYDDAVLAGGPYATLGTTAYAVIDLTAGNWIIWGETPGAPQAPVSIAVTGSPPAAPPAPPADIAIELSEFAFAFSSPLSAGPQVIEVTNAGEQPHFVFIGGVPDGTTVAEAQAAFEAFWNPASAPRAPFSFAESPEHVGTGDQSPGTTAWYAVDLPAGTVVVACFVTDPDTGQPHAMLGMTQIVEVV